jgi:hypothetical protein
MPERRKWNSMRVKTITITVTDTDGVKRLFWCVVPRSLQYARASRAVQVGARPARRAMQSHCRRYVGSGLGQAGNNACLAATGNQAAKPGAR